MERPRRPGRRQERGSDRCFGPRGSRRDRGVVRRQLVPPTRARGADRILHPGAGAPVRDGPAPHRREPALRHRPDSRRGAADRLPPLGSERGELERSPGRHQVRERPGEGDGRDPLRPHSAHRVGGQGVGSFHAPLGPGSGHDVPVQRPGLRPSGPDGHRALGRLDRAPVARPQDRGLPPRSKSGSPGRGAAPRDPHHPLGTPVHGLHHVGRGRDLLHRQPGR